MPTKEKRRIQFYLPAGEPGPLRCPPIEGPRPLNAASRYYIYRCIEQTRSSAKMTHYIEITFSIPIVYILFLKYLIPVTK